MRLSLIIARFNEAGAFAPEISDPDAVAGHAIDHASMRPGLLPRRYLCPRVRCCALRLASMRPGLLPRRYAIRSAAATAAAARFNEAGAFAPEI